MLNPGSYDLAVLQITAALSAQAQTAIEDLDGMERVSIEAEFLYGSGGTTCAAVVQTRFGGGNWRDIARFDFTTASATKHATLTKDTKAVTAYAALASEGVYDRVLGDELRAVITSTGVYGGSTTLSVRASVG
jgi:hypothetical protein